MLRIRLSRTGKKKQASYRVVVTDVEGPRDGRIVERIGYYNPLPDPIEYQIKESRALYWLSVGAQPSDAVRRLLEKQGTFDRLGRLRAGEPLEMLVAEYQGLPLAESVAAAAEEAVAEATDAVTAVAETVEETVAEATDAVTAVAETVEETVAEAADVATAVAETVEETVTEATDVATAVVEEAEAVIESEADAATDVIETEDTSVVTVDEEE